MEKALSRRSGIALWRQIADEIRSGLTGNLADGSGKLPGEIVLASRFGVNRHTVRTALRALSEEGLVETRHGEGTFVLERPQIVYPLKRRTRFSEGIGNQAGSKRGQLLSSVQETADATIAAELSLHTGTPVIRIETMAKADGQPISRSTSWFEAARFTGIDTSFSDAGSMTEALRRHCVEDYIRKSTRVQARHATDSEITELRLSPGAIVLVTKAINATLKGEVFQYSVTRFPADKVTFCIETEIDG